MTAEYTIRPLEKKDDRSDFDCGVEELNLFFHRYAGQNQFRHHIGTTYVAATAGTILGYATVSPATLESEQLPSGKRLPPFPIPVLRVARLAVDRRATRLGIGKSLLRHCFELAEKMRDEYGCTGVLVDAKRSSVRFYRSYGFIPLNAVEGIGTSIPHPTPMFLSLISIPRRKR